MKRNPSVNNAGSQGKKNMKQEMSHLTESFAKQLTLHTGILSICITTHVDDDGTRRRMRWHTNVVQTGIISPELKKALKVYARSGFDYLKAPIGNSGNTGCSLWMLKSL